MITFNHTKVLATVGPAVDSEAKLEALIKNGVTGFRLNFSHGDNAERERQTKWLRAIAKKQGKNVAILGDLQGPKIRLGVLNDNHYNVKRGDILELVFGGKHEENKLPIQYNIARNVKKGERVTLFDGKISAKVESVRDKVVKIKVENSGFLMSHKALNLPDTDFGGNVLTVKDLEDLRYIAKNDYDYVAISFVHSAQDILDVRKKLHGYKRDDIKIVAKIETRNGVMNLEEIVKASDGVMVARGDMAVEVGEEVVPIVERKIIELCQLYGKFSIVATQMLGSMVENPYPSRAEVNDVSTAAILGADVVMLSDETANGKYPIDAVKVMKKTLAYAQDFMSPKPIFPMNIIDEEYDPMAIHAVELAEKNESDAIVAETDSGRTVQSLALRRPTMPIIAVTAEQRIANQNALIFGVESVIVKDKKLGYGQRAADKLTAQKFFGTKKPRVIVVSREHKKSDEADTITELNQQ